tara:strand:+ start:234 stop:1088 length:855 start_codon:yes stop_codon:yes gene_type:complete
MKKTKLGIDKILTISLPKRQDRRDKFQSRFNFLDFSFVDGVVGSKLDISKLLKDKTLNKVQYDPMGSVNKGVIGCSLSHLRCWEIFQESGDEICLILEDDAIITKPLVEITTNEQNEGVIKTSKYWIEMWEQLQSLDWDVIYLGKKEKFVDGVDVTSLFCKPFWMAGMFGAHSYLINKKSVGKLIKQFKPIKYAVDVFLDLMIEEMNVYALKESLFRQETDIYLHDTVDLKKVDSDTYHNDNEQGNFTKVKVDDIVESVEFINYPTSKEYTDKRWPPLIKLNLR